MPDRPIDLVLVSGDMTDAGTSAEWAEFLDILEPFPSSRRARSMLPGNHDVNIVDRANPARLDLPFSPMKALRRMRALSAIAAFQGGRVRTTCAAASRYARQGARAAAAGDRGVRRPAAGTACRSVCRRLWNETFPIILPPESENGLGVAILDSNADTHFSFTNALGMIPADQARRVDGGARRASQAPAGSSRSIIT